MNILQINPGMAGALQAAFGAGSAQGVEAGGVAESPYLGVEEMMVLLSTRLGKLDDEVKVMMANQQKRIDQRAAIKAFENAMAQYQPPKSDAQYQEMRAKMEQAINALPEGDPIRHDLERQLAKLDSANTACQSEFVIQSPSGVVPRHEEKVVVYAHRSKDAWLADKQEVSTMAENLGDQAEMEMLTLQSAMTKRTTLVQLTTNIVQKLEAAPDMIAKNI